MKLFSALLNALRSRRTARRADPDPAEMGTAFGLDSTITLLDPALPSGWSTTTSQEPVAWQQPLTRRSRL